MRIIERNDAGQAEKVKTVIFIDVVLNTGDRFSLRERNGVLEITADDTLVILPRAANQVRLFVMK